MLRISAAAEFRAHQGRIAVFLLNKTSGTINNLAVNLPTNDSLGLKKQDPPSVVQPNEEVKLLLAVECIRPFTEIPELTFDFVTLSGAFSYNLLLPCTVASFAEPIIIEKADYMMRWKSLEGEGRETQEVFTCNPNLPASVELVGKIKSSLFPALHLGLAPGLDSETTATACCSIRTGTLAQDGVTNVSVGAMVRLEADINGGRYRITVRAKHPSVAHALRDLVKAHLG